MKERKKTKMLQAGAKPLKPVSPNPASNHRGNHGNHGNHGNRADPGEGTSSTSNTLPPLQGATGEEKEKRPRSGSSTSSVLPKVISDEFLTCKICFEMFIRPKILDCLHTFCLQCLLDHVSRSQLTDFIPCPLCRQATGIPSGGVEHLRDNFFIANLQDAMDLSHAVGKGGVKRVCDSCKTRQESKPSTMKCLDCNEFLCDECILAHQRLNLTKNHKMVLIVVERRRSSGVLMKNLVITGQSSEEALKGKHNCKTHTGEECKLFCEQCKVMICVKCKLTTHEGHKTCGFEKAAQQEKQKLSKLLTEVKNRATEYGRILEDWKKYEGELKKQKQTLQQKLEMRRHDLHSYIDGWHFTQSQQLDAIYQDEKKKVESKFDLVEVHMDTTQGVCDLADNILEHAKVRQFLSLKDQIASDLGKLQRENINAMCLTQKCILGFSVNPRTPNFDHLGSLSLAHEKVLSSVRLRSVQKLTFVRSFRSRDEISGTRYDCSSLSVTPRGELLVTDRQLDKISTFSETGERVLDVSVSLMGKPICATATHQGELVFTRDKSSVCVFTAAGQHKQVIKDGMGKPCSVKVTADERLYVLDHEQKTLHKYDAVTYVKQGHVKLTYRKSSVWDKISVNSQGNIYLSAYGENLVYEFTERGERLAVYGRWGSSEPGDLYSQRGMCLDQHDNVIIADTNNDRIQMLSPQGAWTLLQTPSEHSVTSPTDVTVTCSGLLCVLEKCGKVKVYEYLPY